MERRCDPARKPPGAGAALLRGTLFAVSNQRFDGASPIRKNSKPEETMPAVKSLSRRETRKTLALVLAGGSGTRLRGLTRNRAKPAVPFGGHHRVVDYALSNCVNSGITDIAVLTQDKSQSLIRHLQRNWLAGRFADSLEIWPAQRRNGCGWDAGTGPEQRSLRTA